MVLTMVPRVKLFMSVVVAICEQCRVELPLPLFHINDIIICRVADLRPTHLIESHISGYVVRRQVTEEGEVRCVFTKTCRPF